MLCQGLHSVWPCCFYSQQQANCCKKMERQSKWISWGNCYMELWMWQKYSWSIYWASVIWRLNSNLLGINLLSIWNWWIFHVSNSTLPRLSMNWQQTKNYIHDLHKTNLPLNRSLNVMLLMTATQGYYKWLISYSWGYKFQPSLQYFNEIYWPTTFSESLACETIHYSSHIHYSDWTQ